MQNIQKKKISYYLYPQRLQSFIKETMIPPDKLLDMINILTKYQTMELTCKLVEFLWNYNELAEN